jgi:predicted AAA+ superfamily ATPase
MYPRLAERRIREALSDTRIVMVAGPRQAGKTTLAHQVAGERMPFLTLDDATTRAGALADPVGFIRRLDRAVIDEVQRAPELLLALKASVDADPSPGRFLLTGSANLMTLPRVADSLAGRMEIIRLLPLAQAEIKATAPAFLDQVFAGAVPPPGALVVGDELVETVLAGGYPEALTRRSWARRQDWYLDYIEALVQRDIRDIAQIEQIQQMPQLLRMLAQHAGQLINYTGLGAPLGMNHVTTQKYIGIFESLFLVRSLQPWYTNALKRLTKTPKLHFLDSGLLAAVGDVTPDRLRRDRSAFGALLETFVFAELLKAASWAHERVAFSHFRDKERNEVDIVMENRRSQIVGIEVKAAASVTRSDFHGLRRLAEACGDRFVLGLVLYDHDQVIPFAERMLAAPLSSLWS